MWFCSKIQSCATAIPVTTICTGLKFDLCDVTDSSPTPLSLSEVSNRPRHQLLAPPTRPFLKALKLVFLLEAV